MMGSHLDTQPTGGKFDGVLGVLGALEVMRSLNDMNIRTRHPIEIANWTNEEGSRFAPAMVSSGVFAGVYTEEWAKSRLDPEGKALGDELARIGFQGPEPVGGRPIHAFFELHIEQGPILEDENIDIGVVTHGQGQRWYEVNLTGFESHAGSTPMKVRKDAAARRWPGSSSSSTRSAGSTRRWRSPPWACATPIRTRATSSPASAS